MLGTQIQGWQCLMGVLEVVNNASKPLPSESDMQPKSLLWDSSNNTIRGFNSNAVLPASRIRPSELGGGRSQLICRVIPQAGTSKACHQGPSSWSPKTDATASQGSSGGSEAHVDLLLSDLLCMLASCSSSPPLTFFNFFEDLLNNTSPDHCKYNQNFL